MKSALVAVAFSDGLHEDEAKYILQQALMLGVDAEPLLAEPGQALEMLTRTSSLATARVVYRDCFILAHVDGVVTEQELTVLGEIRKRLGVTVERARALEAWAEQFTALLDDGERLVLD